MSTLGGTRTHTLLLFRTRFLVQHVYLVPSQGHICSSSGSRTHTRFYPPQILSLVRTTNFATEPCMVAVPPKSHPQHQTVHHCTFSLIQHQLWASATLNLNSYHQLTCQDQEYILSKYFSFCNLHETISVSFLPLTYNRLGC